MKAEEDMRHGEHRSPGYNGLASAVLAESVHDYTNYERAQRDYKITRDCHRLCPEEVMEFIDSERFDMWVDAWGEQTAERARRHFKEAMEGQ